jgi:prolyl 4-hydroxylase
MHKPDLDTLRRDAQHGVPAAQYNLGVWHLTQKRPDADLEAARAAFQAAADQDFAPAVSALGYLYLRAQGVDYDAERAAALFDRAAALGFVEARYRLAEMRAAGYGLAQDIEAARQTFQLAAEEAHPAAMTQLAYCLMNGLGCAADFVAATRWYKAAAEKNEPRAYCALGWRLESGHTLSRDPVRALACYLRAGALGYYGGAIAGNRLAQTLDESQLAAAQILSQSPIETGAPVETGPPGTIGPPHIVSWRPRCFTFRDFLTQEECLHLISIARPFVRPSQVLMRATGERKVHPARRSSNARLVDPLRDLVVWNIEQRLARYAMLPTANGEPLTILRYGPGDEYRPHTDYYHPDDEGAHVGLSQGGQRVATFLVFLNDVEAGGATDFPDAGLSVAPHPGTGLLFFNCLPDGSPDTLSVHAGTPVRRGEKWLLSRWIRTGTYPLSAG